MNSSIPNSIRSIDEIRRYHKYALFIRLKLFRQLCQSESDPKRSLHYQHYLHRASRVDAETRICLRSSWENANLFIMSNCIWTHATQLGERPRTKSLGTTASHHPKYEPENAF